MAERYAKWPIADEVTYEKKLEVTRAYLCPDSCVLEFGCGTGSTALIHAPRVKSIHAIDVAPKMIQIAQGKAAANSVRNITFACSSLDAYIAPDRTWDVILGLNVLHLLDNWQEVVAKVHKLLKPGGVFISSTACLGDSLNFLKLIAPLGQFLGLLPPVRFFTTAVLVKTLIAAGFEIDYKWQPGKFKAVFIVAKKAQSIAASESL